MSVAENASVAIPRPPRLRRAAPCPDQSTRTPANGTAERVRHATVSKADAPDRSTAWKSSGSIPHMK